MAIALGKIQAEESPCIIRPTSKNIGVPFGDMAIKKEPIILKTNPIFVNLIRPNLSPKLPRTTIKRPENKAARLTAVLLASTLIPKSVRIVVAIFNIV